MTTTSTPPAPTLDPAPEASSAWLRDPTYHAFWLLWIGFFVAPVLFGIDKFFNWMTFWPKYLWVGIPHFLSVSPQNFMYAVGVVEIIAGILVLVIPRYAAYVSRRGWPRSLPISSSSAPPRGT